jgi:type I restriction enzyme M protein
MESARIPNKKIKEQLLLFTEDNLLPELLPKLSDLHPSHNLSAVFDDCHNYIYANEGLLKSTIFHEMVKLLMMKMYDEQHSTERPLLFGITANEQRMVMSGQPNEFTSRLDGLFATIRSRYPGLFDDSTLKLKPQTLAYVIARLQLISISQTPGDKGKRFKHLCTDINAAIAVSFLRRTRSCG